MASLISTPPQATVSPLENGQSQRTLVLVLEDNDTIATLLGVVLAKIGLRTHWCETGAEALAVFQAEREKVAFIYADCCLPDGDGREFCRILRETEPELPVLLSSGHATKLHPGALQNRRGVYFLPKPYAPVELLARVQKLRRESTRRPW